VHNKEGEACFTELAMHDPMFHICVSQRGAYLYQGFVWIALTQESLD